MIGQHEDAPVRIYLLRVFEGDGHIISGSYVRGIYATEERARAIKNVFRGGPSCVEEGVLLDDGSYVFHEI